MQFVKMGVQHRWLWFFFWIVLHCIEVSTKEVRVVCYYTNWSVYRPGNAKFSPQNINPYLCTHLVYAFGGFTKENTLKPFDKYQDVEKGGYAKFTGLKTYNKNLKTMLAIGGWNEGSSRFSPMVASAERRKELVKNVVKFLRQNHFDGLDLDWEYPSFRDGGKPRDRDNYAQLVQELREEFERESEKTGRSRLLLTMAVPAGIEYINKGYDVPKLMKYLDWMNILSYDYHSAFEPSVNHHAPLYPLEEENEYNYDTELNIDHTIKHYLKAGAISNKLVLGIPTYGRSYTLYNPDANDIGAPADGPGEMGEATRENGYLAYYEVCEAVNSGEWTVVQPNDEAMGPYAYKDNQWVGYDDESIARKKAQYVAAKDLGGIMFWSIDNDDFRGSCHNKSYPIIEAAKEALIESLGRGEDNSIQKPSKTTKPRILRNRNKATKSPDLEPTTERTRHNEGRKGNELPSVKPTRRRIQSGTRRRQSGSKQSTTEAVSEAVTRSGSSLVVTTPNWITPSPPTTPDPGGDFKCEDEGFYPHPRDCKKYFWCLNGPSELGIIAHQFTCPSGLYFNKAASSCDYTQNVLCNKKKSTSTASTTNTPTNKPASTTATEDDTKKFVTSTLLSTRRPPPKITAATSKTTFVSTPSTTTPEYIEDDYDYEEEDAHDAGNSDSDTDSEDPKVIKELLELIKKAGGIEELEKQLNLKEEVTAVGDSRQSTTTPPINQRLYQRVLAKTKLVDPALRENSLIRNRNSRGPQNEGLIHVAEDKTTSKPSSRFKYSTINRSRPSKITPENEDETENESEDKIEQQTATQDAQRPKYISLRRNRPSTTAEPTDDEDNVDDVRDGRRVKQSTTTLKTPYVTLRRFRPTTSSIPTDKDPSDRKTFDVEAAKADFGAPNYVNLYRGRSTTTTVGTPSKYSEFLSSTTPFAHVEEYNLKDKEEISEYTTTSTTTTISTTTTTTITPPTTKRIANIKPTNTRITLHNDAISFEQTTQPIITTSNTSQIEIIEPHLLEPRPFSIVASSLVPAPSDIISEFPSTIAAPLGKSSTAIKSTDDDQVLPKRNRRPVSRLWPEVRRTSSAASQRPIQRTRPTRRSRTQPRQSTTAGPPSSTTESRERTTNRFRTWNRRRVLPSSTRTSVPSKDQNLESTNLENSTELQDTTSPPLADLAIALNHVQKAGVPTQKPHLLEREMRKSRIQIANSIATTMKPETFDDDDLELISKVRISTPQPFSHDKGNGKETNVKQTQSLERIVPLTFHSYSYRPISDYDYYDDGETKLSIPAHSKVLIHSSGVIQCLDQGNFPHPVSCKKFISCAKMETGTVLGWEYTCPKNLSFDPIGGMCNWSAGFGCNE